MRNFFVLILIAFITTLSAQEKFPITLFCKKNNVVRAEVSEIRATSTKIPITSNGQVVNVKLKTVDSIHFKGDRYLVFKEGLITYTIKKIVSLGNTSLFFTLKKLEFCPKGTNCINANQSNYTKLYRVFCTNEKTIPPILERDSFINLVKQYNLNHSGLVRKKVIYDSLRQVNPLVVFHLGLLRPSLGLQFKPFKRIAFYSGGGVNLIGFLWRETRTFFNFDYINELRFYINYNKLLKKGGSVRNGSGNYIGLHHTYFMDNGGHSNVHVYGIAFGLKSNPVINNLYLNQRYGLGIAPHSGKFYTIWEINFGLAF